MALWLQNTGRRPEAERVHHELREFYEKLAAGASSSPDRARSRPAAYRRLATEFERMGQLPEARQALRSGLTLAPDDPDLQIDLARSLLLDPDGAKDETTEAIDLAKRAAAAKSNDCTSLNTLTLAYLRSGQLPLAAETVKKAMELPSPPGDGSEQLLMAMIAWRRGEKQAALDWYIQALDKSSPRTLHGPAVPSLRAEADRVLGRLAK